MAVTHNVTLDVDKNRMRLDQSVHVRTGDKSSQTVKCALTKDGAAYTPASGTTAKLEILKPDNTWTVTSATVSGSNVSGVVPLEAMSAPGECKRAYFRLISGSTEDTTEDFHLHVFPNAYDQAIESRPYSDQLDELIEAASEELQDTIDEVRDMRIAVDGRAYASAGDAVRGQVEQLSVGKANKFFSDYEELSVDTESGWYNADTGAILADSTMVHALVTDGFTVGEPIKFSGRYGGSHNFPALAFLDSNDHPIKKCGTLNQHSYGEKAIVPAGTVKIAINAAVNVTGLHIYVPMRKVDLGYAVNEIDVINSEIARLLEWVMADCNFESGAYWHVIAKRLFTDGASAWKYGVVELGKAKFKVSGWGSTTAPVVVFFNGEPSANTQMSYMLTGADHEGETYGSGAIYRDFEFDVPEGAKYAIVQSPANIVEPAVSIKALNVSDNRIIAYSVNNGILEAVTDYDGTKKISVSFGKRGPNNIPDFRHIVIGSETKFNNSTDWHGPYIVKAVSNIDGDDVSNRTATGGNHNYNNDGTMNYSATGRNVSLDFYADGEKLSEGDIGFATSIEICWVNRVQGYNTKKVDGSGREILEERHRMTFDGCEWVSYLEIVPLENIHVDAYYGFQCTVNNWGTVQYIGADYRLPFPYTTPHDSGNATPNICVCHDNNDRLEMELDRTLDLGKGSMSPASKGFWTGNYGKTYSFLISDQDLSEDCVYAARGIWRFMPNYCNVS